MEKKLSAKRPLLYLVTDRSILPHTELIRLLEEAAAAGIDLIQIREKDLMDRELCLTVGEAVRRLQKHPVRILVNDRFDIALACGAHGVHLAANSLPADVVRRQVREDLLIGVSAHSLDEVRLAAEQGADFTVLGPVFETPSKRNYGPPLGLEPLRRACPTQRLPILAIGGIDLSRIALVRDAGCAGIAAIRLFATAGKLADLVTQIRAAWNRVDT